LTLYQDESARAEANFICNTDNQYIVPTSGNPIRGLIQDHVVSGVKLTCRNTFLDKAQYQQLVYNALCGLEGHIVYQIISSDILNSSHLQLHVFVSFSTSVVFKT
jgi:DNA-directed RNA polymerase beta' subunit